ncbi:MAG: zinc ribbon domain-containing protein [Candidatus Electrothrix sp. AR4]|nr:zinc ribbon domain-containing protein [Candidatus Electrothrix sp. AR4]
MPVYEYECPACEKVFEVQQRINDQPLTCCSVCGGDVKKLVSMSAFHLKGGGWYSDGYASGSKDKDKESGGGQKKTSPAAKKESAGKETQAAPSLCQGGESAGCKGCPAPS